MHHTLSRLAALLLASVLTSTLPAAAQDRSPLELHADHFVNFETGNTIPKRSLRLWTGSHQTAPGRTPGTGNQMYYGGGEWAVGERVQLGFSVLQFDDLLPETVNGIYPHFIIRSYSLNGKYALYSDTKWNIAAKLSAEYFQLAAPTYNEPSITGHVVGSFHLPISYSASDRLQFHLTPSVSVFPDQINGVGFYGTVAAIGAGVTYRPTQRWLTYGAVNVPLTGGNVLTRAGTMDRAPVWTVGGRYNVTPKAALDIFATNGMGMTPATSILPFIPEGDVPMIGVMINYTPGRSAAYRPNYRGTPSEPLMPRNRRLQLDGFTLSSGDTLAPGRVILSGHGGTDAYGGSLQFSPDFDGQIEATYEQFANDGSVGLTQLANFESRWGLGLKLRFMDQNNGSPISLSLHGRMGRDTSPEQNGVFYLAMPITYKVSDRLALNINPKFAAWGDARKFGLGLGLNYAVTGGLDLIGEVTPVNDGDRVVWAAGLRGHVKAVPLHFDLYATNAVGRTGLGAMVGQSSTRLALTATLDLDLKRR